MDISCSASGRQSELAALLYITRCREAFTLGPWVSLSVSVIAASGHTQSSYWMQLNLSWQTGQRLQLWSKLRGERTNQLTRWTPHKTASDCSLDGFKTPQDVESAAPWINIPCKTAECSMQAAPAAEEDLMWGINTARHQHGCSGDSCCHCSNSSRYSRLISC